jgi:hypothetical protein
MPKISIIVSDYTYWTLLGSGENISYVIQKALKKYWKDKQVKHKDTTLSLQSEEHL